MNPTLGPIVVPLDGTSFAEDALTWAVPLARRRGSAIRLIQVIPIELGEGDAIQEIQSRLSVTAARIRRENVPCDVEVGIGEPAGEISRRARAARADLITLAVRGGMDLGKPGLGRTAARLVQRAMVPVVIQTEATLRRQVALSREGPILVPFDGSELAEMAASEAVGMAAVLNVEILLVRAIDPAWSFEASLPPNPYVDNAIDEMTEGYLWGIAEWVRRHGIAARTAYARADPAGFILDQARRAAVSLICMAYRGESGPARLDPGRIADAVLTAADVPVLLIGPFVLGGRRSPLRSSAEDTEPRRREIGAAATLGRCGRAASPVVTTGPSGLAWPAGLV